MKAEKKFFGKTKEGHPVDIISFESSGLMRGELISYGAALKSLYLPDRAGVMDEVTYGFGSLAEYEENRCYFGASIGRVANRIKGGKFFIDGTPYQLTLNAGENHLHGGFKGFDRIAWDSELFLQPNAATVVFTYESPDGEEGYPGNLRASIAYTITDDNELSIIYKAESDKLTPFSPTNHSFWNLAGVRSGTILNHELELNCDFYLPAGDDKITTGEIRSVKGTPMDFTLRKRIGQDIDAVKPDGYDNCYVVNPAETDLRRAAILYDPGSGRKMEVLTMAPGVQIFSGNTTLTLPIANGLYSQRRGGFCIETEFFPDAVNKTYFKSPLLNPGEVFHSTTIHRFSAD